MISNQQLTFDLPLRTAHGRDDFLVTESNRAAVGLIDQWPSWSVPGAVIVGPAGSGKTHLAEVFREKSGAILVPASTIGGDNLPMLFDNAALVIEDVAAGDFDEIALFHVFNLAAQNKKQILLTSQSAPTSWAVKLADLRTRLATLAAVPLLLPDDELMRGVLLKQFHDRQLAVPEGILSYMLARIPRSLDTARELVTEIDRRALVQRLEITRPFVAAVMKDVLAPRLDAMENEPS